MNSPAAKPFLLWEDDHPKAFRPYGYYCRHMRDEARSMTWWRIFRLKMRAGKVNILLPGFDVEKCRREYHYGDAKYDNSYCRPFWELADTYEAVNRRGCRALRISEES